LKAGKKSLAMPFVRGLYSRAIDAMGATGLEEARSIARWAPSMPVLLTDDTPDSIQFGSPSLPDGPLALLFLARVHPTKGLLPLLQALRDVKALVDLDIAGPIGDSEYWQRCAAEIASLPTNVQARYVGTVQRPEIPGLLHNHDVLVSLTAGEGFGHTFAEALQAGCPVLATDRTSWTPVLTGGGGWVVADREDTAAISAIISSIAGLSHNERSQNRRRARAGFEEWARNRQPNIVTQVIEWRDGVRPAFRE
jgi:glycosyltransferase involved in cell wall biosynthesis